MGAATGTREAGSFAGVCLNIGIDVSVLDGNFLLQAPERLRRTCEMGLANGWADSRLVQQLADATVGGSVPEFRVPFADQGLAIRHLGSFSADDPSCCRHLCLCVSTPRPPRKLLFLLDSLPERWCIRVEVKVEAWRSECKASTRPPTLPPSSSMQDAGTLANILPDNAGSQAKWSVCKRGNAVGRRGPERSGRRRTVPPYGSRNLNTAGSVTVDSSERGDYLGRWMNERQGCTTSR